jgi:ATP phosphoribosyltransferase regulatory subunit HisZ
LQNLRLPADALAALEDLSWHSCSLSLERLRPCATLLRRRGQWAGQRHRSVRGALRGDCRSNSSISSAIRYDAAFGRPLDYYTGLVFEISTPGATQPLIGGGRYDRLLTLLGADKPIPGVGFSVWLDRIENARAG